MRFGLLCFGGAIVISMEPRRDILTELWEVLLGEKAVLWDAAHVWSVGFWMKRKKNTVRPIQKMTELNEVIEEGGLHSTGKCKSYGEDAGFIATKGTRAGKGEKLES